MRRSVSPSQGSGRLIRHQTLRMLLAEARESKANVRERMKFRLAQLTGAEVCEPRKLPITPVSGAAIQAIGNPLDAFLLEELGRCVGNCSHNH